MKDVLYVNCLIDGKRWIGKELPDNVEFVGMETYPNQEPRYGKLYHPWFNYPCYETVKICLS